MNFQMSRRNMLFLAALLASSGVSAAGLPQLAFEEMYSGGGVLGMKFSEKLQSLAGKQMSIRGFLAPPLKADAHFLVLTRDPVNLCPFCNSDEDWPDNILVVYLGKSQRFVQANELIEVTGRLELGSHTDPETGFVSLVRVMDASYRRI